MAIYSVKNQWGGPNKPWHDGGIWILGCRTDQKVIQINITSEDHGKTFTGEMVYEGEGTIGIKATQIGGNNYQVENQWGGSEAEWHPGGNWIIGGRDNQTVVELHVSNINSNNLIGSMTYDGEGPIAFEGAVDKGTSYTVENQWGGDSAAWNLAGTVLLGTRPGQKPVDFDISSADDGKNLTGTMTYDGEGPIGFKAELISANNYTVENQWGGDEAPWHEAGTMIIGARDGQNVVSMKISSDDNGDTFTGQMTYKGEGEIGVKAAVSSCNNKLG